jgi:CTP synthase (UTP-ammonia lyase)
MSHLLKIAIIGDYNFTLNAHHATNISIDHSASFLELEVNYYWIRVSEAVQHKPTYFDQFDGVWIAPGSFQNLFFLNGIFKAITARKIPVLITGEAFKFFIDFLILNNSLNPGGEKLISENLVSGNQFERVTILPKSKIFQKLYENFSDTELTSSRFSLYPQLLELMDGKIIDVEANNQFDDPEIISLHEHPFFVACAFCPQISSTRDIPHPIIYTFLKMSLERNQSDKH